MKSTRDGILLFGFILIILILNGLFSPSGSVSNRERLTQADKDRSAIKEADGKANSLIKRTKNMISQLA